jgi:hypothetical protein
MGRGDDHQAGCFVVVRCSGSKPIVWPSEVLWSSEAFVID